MRDRRRIVAFCRIQRNLWLLSSARADVHVKGIARGRTVGGPEYTCNLFPFFFFMLFPSRLEFICAKVKRTRRIIFREYASVFLDRLRYWFSRENTQILIYLGISSI